jgi:hypothetical protein
MDVFGCLHTMRGTRETKAADTRVRNVKESLQCLSLRRGAGHTGCACPEAEGMRKESSVEKGIEMRRPFHRNEMGSRWVVDSWGGEREG